MPSLVFRLPGRAEVLSARLAFLFPTIDRATRKRWIEAARVRVDGRVADRPGLACRAGARIEIESFPSEALDALPETPRSGWLAWVDAPPSDGGALTVGEAGELEWKVVGRCDGLAVIGLVGASCRADAVCAALARDGLAVVGDLRRGGLGVAGGCWIQPLPDSDLELESGIGSERLLDSELAELAARWPEEPAWPAAESDGEPLRLRVSEETLRALDKGHPWILPDEASESVEAFRPGSLLRIEGRAGRVAGWAHVEGDARLAGRVWARGELAVNEIASVESRIARALARRRALWETAAEVRTDAFRLIHGEADDLPGLFVDRLGPLLRVVVSGRATEGFRERAIDALLRQRPVTPEGHAWSILELLNLRSSRSIAFDSVRWLAGGVDALAAAGAEVSGAVLTVEERGLRYGADPGWDTPRQARPGFGLFLDQRENRARLAPLAARGGRWLNLFAHTGAFSVSLLAAGAESTVSVDLSAPYLARLETNLEANRDRGVDPERNVSLRVDGRRYLESLASGETFAGIVVDPPTAAAAGRRFWSVRQDLEPLLRLCVGRLSEAGALLVTQNQRGAPRGLDRVLERIASRAHRRVARLEPAPPGLDHPMLAGFPEGDAFEGWLLVLE